MSDPGALDPYYRQAQEQAREFVTLIKVAEEMGADPDGHDIRGQIRQYVRANPMLGTWLLIEVLARSVAATFDDLEDWSAAIVATVAEEETP
jgi:hypothetical protein